jgi:DNA (cytosine-5)-methyltransferase 1
MSKLTVLDFFCGAGGFSEGFRQQGFEIIHGYDYWKPAIETFNHNYGDGKGILLDILQFENSVELIESIPDTDIILGSPPCVSFSSSNNSGKADKSLGVKLTETFLKIVAVKKFKPNSILKGWFMENVTNSTTYLARTYNFKDLGLSEWAKRNRYSPKKIAIIIEGNSVIINSAEYGSAQIRKRVITGEIINQHTLIIPPKTHDLKGKNKTQLLPYKKLSFIKDALPETNSNASDKSILDPNYPELKIKQTELTDHFYDTGLYESEWKTSKFLKVNHPYMGTMSFPENEDRPSRTVTATKIGSSREALIYKSEYNRVGNGEFRTPTVREAACIMGFPITYQFIGSEGTKWRLVGNAVCPSVSRAFASMVRSELGLKVVRKLIVIDTPNLINVTNLNTFKELTFNTPKIKKHGSRFRRHPFKEGNITVTLSNYDILKNEKKADKWLTSVQYGSGEGFPCIIYREGFYKEIEPIIKSIEKGEEFIKLINNGFSKKIGSKEKLQLMYETQKSQGDLLEPTALVDHIAELIDKFSFEEPIFEQNSALIFDKKFIPKKQLFALYAINKVTSIANELAKSPITNN